MTTRMTNIMDETAPIQIADTHIHFVGIGGCGMSGLARLTRQFGGICTGSDMNAGDTTRTLEADGIAVALEQSADSVPDDCELLVVSAAIKPDHPERQAAEARGIPTIKYAQMLGRLMLGRTGVAVAGTHGKSTTTSMLSHIAIACGLDPSFIVGANCRQIGGGWRCGQSDLLFAEACEYDRSFHHLHPKHALILNVEADHLDLYSSIDEIVEAFKVFAHRVPEDGSVLINHEMSHRLAITAGLDCAVQTLGFAPQADWRVDIEQDSGDATAGPGVPLTVLYKDNERIAAWRSPIPGEHMAYNAAAAAITAHRLGAAWRDIEKAIADFQGLDRRMQLVGTRPPAHEKLTHEKERITVIDDYGHHPTEIDTTLRALRQHYQPERLVCVFQPHQHSRTRFLMEQFATSFSEADIVIVPHIYFVRDSEQERHAVSAADLVDRLRKQGQQALHLYPFEAIVEHLQIIARPGDLIVTMGAGDVWQIARAFLK